VSTSLKYIALGVALAHAAQGLPALDSVYNLVSSGKILNESPERFDIGWKQGSTDLLADLEETGYWNFALCAFAVPLKTALSTTEAGGFKALHYKLNQLGVNFFYRTSGDDLYTILIDIGPDPSSMDHIVEVVKNHSVLYCYGEDDAKLGRVLSAPYMGKSL